MKRSGFTEIQIANLGGPRRVEFILAESLNSRQKTRASMPSCAASLAQTPFPHNTSLIRGSLPVDHHSTHISTSSGFHFRPLRKPFSRLPG